MDVEVKKNWERMGCAEIDRVMRYRKLGMQLLALQDAMI